MFVESKVSKVEKSVLEFMKQQEDQACGQPGGQRNFPLGGTVIRGVPCVRAQFKKAGSLGCYADFFSWLHESTASSI